MVALSATKLDSPDVAAVQAADGFEEGEELGFGGAPMEWFNVEEGHFEL